MKAPANDLELAEEQSEALQSVCDDALRVILCSIELTRITAATIERIDPKLFTFKASPELQSFAESYTKIAKLRMPKNMLKARPEMIRKAVAMLKIVP